MEFKTLTEQLADKENGVIDHQFEILFYKVLKIEKARRQGNPINLSETIAAEFDKVVPPRHVIRLNNQLREEKIKRKKNELAQRKERGQRLKNRNN